MSILIEGMNKELFFRILLAARCGMFQKGECDSYYGYKVKELPRHGRLIDADAVRQKMHNKVAKLQKVIDDYSRWSEERKDAITDKYMVLRAEKWIAEAPTIIEAEVEE